MSRLLCVAGFFALCIGSTVFAQGPAQAPSGPNVRTLFTVDSSRVGRPNLSLDGKWVVFVRSTPDNSSRSIWMASMVNPKPFRLTSDGFFDSAPTVSPTGERVFFVSNRPNKGGAPQPTFVMSVPIDPMTGQPTGPVRQVSTDSVPFVAAGGISRDGKWLAYVAQKKSPELRIVPTNGGIARTLATKSTFDGWSTSFSADGKSVLFQDSGATLIKRVPVAGGPVTTLVRVTKGGVMNVAFRDDRYIAADQNPTAPTEFALRDMSGNVLSKLLMPATGDFVLPPDGRGLLSATTTWKIGLVRYSLAASSEQTLGSASSGWPFGVVGDTILRVLPQNGREVLLTTTLSGATIREVTLPPEIETIQGLLPGKTHVLGFGSPVSRTPKPINGAFAKNPIRVAYAIDRVTGIARKVADSVLSGCCPRNWGASEDATGIAELHGDRVDVKALDRVGNLTLVRSISRTIAERSRDGALSGDRLAYVDSTGPNQVALFVTTSPQSAVKQSVALHTARSDIGVAWSPNGKRLAVAYGDASRDNRAVVRIFDVAIDGTITEFGSPLDLGGKTDYVESVTWLPDESGLLVMRDDDPSHKNVLLLRPLDASKPFVRLSPTLNGVDGYMLAPDGKSILLTVGRLSGSSIWMVPFTKNGQR